jgi:hypothetical protein
MCAAFRDERRGAKPQVRAEWRSGSRSAAWEALWRRILAGILGRPNASQEADGTTGNRVHGEAER